MKILHLDSNHELLLNSLNYKGFINIEDYHSDKTTIMKNISTYHGIVLRSRFSIDKAFIDAAENLKFIARVGAGMENIDCLYAESKNIVLISAPEGNQTAVAEHALGMLLNLMNKLNEVNFEVKSGIWKREQNRGIEIEGKTVGIIGYGHMGKAFAQRLQGFNCQVICCDILENIGDHFAKQVSLEEFYKLADIVSLHTPQTSETTHLINQQSIEKFKKPFFFN